MKKKKKPIQQYCITKFCRNKKPKHGRKCPKCQKREYAKNHPIEYAFYNKRTNAKKKGHAFDLTLDEFRKFVIDNNLIGNTDSKSKTGLTIDRKRNDEGYHINNIQVLTRSANSRKRYVDYWAAQEAKHRSPDYQHEDDPNDDKETNSEWPFEVGDTEDLPF